MSSPGIELGTSRTEGRALTETNCATLAPNLFRNDFFSQFPVQLYTFTFRHSNAGILWAIVSHILSVK